MQTRRLVRAALDYRPRGVARIAAWATLLTFIAAGYVANLYSGAGLDHGALFLLPCAATAWYLGLGAGFASVALSGLAWYVAAIVQVPPPDPWTTLLNTLSRFSVFLLIVGLVASVRELTQRLTDLSRLDPLTGLANLREFRARGEHDLEVAARGGLPASILFIDLDDFKMVNDRQGHAAGDATLVAVATVLASAARRSDLAARIGGDEFALLLLGSDEVAARRIAEKIRDALRSKFATRNSPVTFSVGIASAQPGKMSFRDLLAAADEAMYSAKRAGKNTIVAGVASPAG